MSVLVTTAIGGILAVIILGIIDQASRVMVRGNALDSFEGIMRTTGSLLANKLYCDNALRGATSADRIVYNVQDNPVGPPPGGNEVDIQNIFIQTDPNPNHPIIHVYSNPTATAIVSTNPGSSLSNIYGAARVNYIRFRERERGVGRTTLMFNNTAYQVYRGEVEIDVAGLSQTPGGTVRRRIPYNAVVHPLTRTIDGCYQQDSLDAMCRALGGSANTVSQTCVNINNPTAIDCRAECDPAGDGSGSIPATALCPAGMAACTAPTPGQRCVDMFYVMGFNVVNTVTASRSDPICACSPICWESSGATASAASTATATGPGPGPGPAAN